MNNNYRIELRYVDNPNKINPDIVIYVTNEAKHEHDIKIIKGDTPDNEMMVKRIFSEEYTYVYDASNLEIQATGYKNVKPGDENYVKAAAYKFPKYATNLIVEPIV